MKKVILSLIFVITTSVAFVNANQSNETKDLVEEYGCASDCVETAKEGALWEVGEDGDRSAGGELVQAYTRYYETCYQLNCA